MSYTPPFIPRADAAFRTWAENFCNGINSNPWVYALSPADGDWLMQMFRRFDAAFMAANNQLTRTRPAIMDKDDARFVIMDLCRKYAAIIRANHGVTDGDKIAIGVRPQNVGHRRRKAPQTSPLLKIIAATPGEHTMRYHDTNTPNSAAKPFGATSLQLFMAVTGGTKPANIDEAKFVGSYTRNLFGVAHKSKDAGKLATYWGRWAGPRGDVGPWSVPISFTIAWGAAESIEASRPKSDDDQSLRLAA